MWLVVGLYSPFLSAENTITMAFNKDPAVNPQYEFYLKLYTEAFEAIGFQFDYEFLPSARATQMADHGRLDGEPQRVYGYAQRSPNQVRVEEAIFTNRTLAYSMDPTLKLDDLESLRNTDFKVDYLSGSVWSQKHLESVVDVRNLRAVDNPHQGFMKLVKNRSDLFVVLEVIGNRILHTSFKQEPTIHVVAEIGSNLSYPYLHKQHRALVPQLEQALRDMKSSGRYKELLYQTMPYLNKL
ncbi:substrate-binding periplasmic protein [Vibrio mexicanus]|uniref:substrate-binding periplasmic protein n=1 Tax=Vibrio mexicanus TaxID=1004326 RepID=UPI00138E39E2|nr:transporter substrate-binding domain-containing protein [Vibrio mexicanus]